MAYSDFSLRKVKKAFNLQEQRSLLFDDVDPLSISPWLQQSLEIGLDLATSSASEKARSEFIVVPILFELRQKNHNNFAIYSGETLDVDEKRGLKGECDFILTKGEVLHGLQAPIFTLVEAKKNDIGGGLGQCVAQMVGAKLFNEQENTPLDYIFGAVTTGTEWQFLRLGQDIISIEKKIYPIENIGKILGFLQKILDVYNSS